MRLVLALAVTLTALPAGADAPGEDADRLIALAQRATLSEIDPGRAQCGDRRSVRRWLRDLVGRRARSVTWTAGLCRLVIPDSPRDSGGADARCAQGAILARSAREPVTVEIYLERREGSWTPYAFRAAGAAADGWEDYLRFTTEFEASWRAIHLMRPLSDPDEHGCRR